ncbi:exonuclease [Escherichia coli B107]|nr:exonuclease [Escherichia coli B107]
MKFRLGGFEAIKSAYMAQVQYSMWVTRKDAWTLPTMTRA